MVSVTISANGLHFGSVRAFDSFQLHVAFGADISSLTCHFRMHRTSIDHLCCVIGHFIVLVVFPDFPPQDESKKRCGKK